MAFCLLHEGSAGILLGLAWYFIYQDPKQSRFGDSSELVYIEAGGGLVANKERIPFDWTAVFRLLKQRQVLAICLGKYCNNTILVFFTTWFLTYLIEERKMTIIKVGILSNVAVFGSDSVS